MKFSLTTAAVGFLGFVGVVSAAPAGDSSDLEKRGSPLKYFTVHAPPENISPEADAAAKKLEGQVSRSLSLSFPHLIPPLLFAISDNSTSSTTITINTSMATSTSAKPPLASPEGTTLPSNTFSTLSTPPTTALSPGIPA